MKMVVAQFIKEEYPEDLERKNDPCVESFPYPGLK